STYLGVTIQAEEAFAGQLQIINAVGELLQRIDLPKQRSLQYQLPVADLPAGVYFVNVLGENGRQLVEKFVKL
ncbi:MAG: T9SS type A sorting domain-containing protein, partial [Bacteroidota bacterium]